MPVLNILKRLNVIQIIAIIWLLLVLVALVAAPLIAPYDPLAQDIVNRLAPPFSEGHLLGTDEFGRDILSRIIYGAQIEMMVALGATALAAVLGTTLGMIGAYFGGIAETITMRVIVDVLLAFPPIILALLAVTLYGPGPVTLILAMGILFVPTFARVSYGQTLSIKQEEYVQAARAFGSKVPNTLFGVILPNITAPVIVQISLTLAATILLESGLSYLGLGVVPPDPSWGGMMAAGQRFLSSDPHVLLVPGAIVILTILSFGILGDGLRNWLDPKARKRVD